MGLGSFMNNISMPSFSAASLGGGNLTGGAVPFANGGGISQGGNFGSSSGGGGSNNFSGGGNGNFSSGGPGGSFQRN